jgi:hypothetical protein
MNFAQAKAIQEKVRDISDTHYVLRLITPTSDDHKQISHERKESLVLGGFSKPDFLDGATVYAAGAVSPLANCREVIARPSLAWKGWKR